MGDYFEYEIIQKNDAFVVREGRKKYPIDLRKRLFQFAVDSFKFLATLPSRKVYNVFRYQISKSSTSMGANYEEAQGAVSQKDFANKVGICLKESKETIVFLG